MEIDSLKEALSSKDSEMRLLQARIDELSIAAAENEEISGLDQERQREADAAAKVSVHGWFRPAALPFFTAVPTRTAILTPIVSF